MPLIPSIFGRIRVSIQSITRGGAKELGLKDETGVRVTDIEPGSPASSAGIQRSDVIEEVNRKPVKDTQGFLRAMEGAKDGNVLLLVHRRSGNLFVVITAK